jgi:hypothetical protein
MIEIKIDRHPIASNSPLLLCSSDTSIFLSEVSYLKKNLIMCRPELGMQLQLQELCPSDFQPHLICQSPS